KKALGWRGSPIVSKPLQGDRGMAGAGTVVALLTAETAFLPFYSFTLHRGDRPLRFPESSLVSWEPSLEV
ncbi:MAG: hypothetical protein MRZ83_04705, partial [Prevotella sp.]|nr:hypothetical protein [Prevotella sp.]